MNLQSGDKRGSLMADTLTCPPGQLRLLNGMPFKSAAKGRLESHYLSMMSRYLLEESRMIRTDLLLEGATSRSSINSLFGDKAAAWQAEFASRKRPFVHMPKFENEGRFLRGCAGSSAVCKVVVSGHLP